VSAASRESRLDRRKARTRQALIDAAVRLIAEGRGDRASIQEITDEADVGFGSFSPRSPPTSCSTPPAPRSV
jgi:AcrR family transcriptional regulator